MSKRSAKPPLYELINRQRDHGAEADPPRDRGEQRMPSATLSRTIRVPLGYLLIASAAVIVAMVIAYMVAYRVGEQAAKKEFSDRFLDAAGRPHPAARAEDPLATPQKGRQEQDAAGEAVAPRREPDQPMLDSVRGWGPIDDDPRQPGRYYLTLAETVESGARRLADFCRERGLEAYVLSSNNDRFRVLVLPGLESEGMTDPREEPLRQQVYRIGAEWKNRYPRESDLRDAYLRLYRP